MPQTRTREVCPRGSQRAGSSALHAVNARRASVRHAGNQGLLGCARCGAIGRRQHTISSHPAASFESMASPAHARRTHCRSAIPSAAWASGFGSERHTCSRGSQRCSQTWPGGCASYHLRATRAQGTQQLRWRDDTIADGHRGAERPTWQGSGGSLLVGRENLNRRKCAP